MKCETESDMKDDLIPCRKCISMAICNSIIHEDMNTNNLSIIGAVNRLQDRCSDFSEYVQINLLSKILRNMKVIYGR